MITAAHRHLDRELLQRSGVQHREIAILSRDADTLGDFDQPSYRAAPAEMTISSTGRGPDRISFSRGLRGSE